MNFWLTPSKHGGTIQTAVDFLIAQDPKKEDPLDAVPHVAAVAAAYGDPTGKYASFLKRTQSNYQERPYWFYDQTAAFKMAPATKKQRVPSDEFDVLSDMMDTMQAGFFSSDVFGVNGSTVNAGELDFGSDTELPFECPIVFAEVDSVEIDDGIFVTCEELRPFYELAQVVPK